MNQQLSLLHPTPAQTLTSIHHQKALFPQDGIPKKKLVISLTKDLTNLFLAMEQSNIATLLNTATHVKQDEVVYCASFFEELGSLSAKIELFNTLGGFHKVDPFDSLVRYAHQSYSKVSHVNTSKDWMTHNKLWFRKDNQNQYEAFIQYSEAYRDSFNVNLDSPLLSFTISL